MGECPQWAVDVDGYESVMVREDEGSDEYYGECGGSFSIYGCKLITTWATIIDSLTPLPPPCQTASVYAPSPSAYTTYRHGQSDSSPPRYSGAAKAVLPSHHHYSSPAFTPTPKRKLSDASDNSDTWSCLDGF